MSTFGKIGARDLIEHRKFARDYIQDGLVSMWDGINNTGHGHDPEATVWKDLVGNCDLSRNGTPLVKPLCMGFDGSCCFYGSAQFGLISTFEAVIDAKTQIGSADPELVRLGGTREYKYYVNANALSAGISYISGIAGRFGDINTGTQVASWVFDTAPQLTYRNGVYNSSWNVNYPQTATYITVGAGTNGLFRPGVGDVYCIRLYNRALTAEEVAYNYSIDKIRFNLP